MSIMNGWEFQCANSTCLPFITTTAPNLLRCQIHCLGQPQCKAITFQQANLKCQLFINIVDQNSNLQANVETTTMIVISGTRMPPASVDFGLPREGRCRHNQLLHHQQLRPQQHPAQLQQLRPQQHPAQRQQLQAQQLQPQQHQAQLQQVQHQHQQQHQQKDHAVKYIEMAMKQDLFLFHIDFS
ncbi:hypothetical protein I4U23_027181 [Adineta vaga]|nr:hypothetical protein I4U23_027181 [Adineta vaga]